MRLILDPPRSASLNMAIDEMLTEAQSGERQEPALRFYRWEKEAVSIGYFQNVSAVAKRLDCARTGIPVVRRITGGGMVRHGHDLTFSLTLGNPNPYLSSDAKTSYLKVNEALRKGLQPDYPGLDYADCRSIPSGRGQKERVCFEAPVCYDLLLAGKKVVGASQRRLEHSILHQSAVFIEETYDTLIQKIVKGFEAAWQIRLKEQPLTVEELSLAVRKEKERYSDPDWAFGVSLTEVFSS